MTIEETFILANTLLRKHSELINWKVTFHNKKKSFGTCKYSTREILISKSQLPFMNDYGIKMTILHEIAHALTQGHSHDYYWVRKCIEIGGNGERCGKFSYLINGKESAIEHGNLTAKYILTCPVCGKQTFKYKKPKYNSSCGAHGTRGYDEKYKMILTEN